MTSASFSFGYHVSPRWLVLDRQKRKQSSIKSKIGKSIHQQLGGRKGATEREPACISGLLSCWHITARTVTFGLVPPPHLSLLYPKRRSTCFAFKWSTHHRPLVLLLRKHTTIGEAGYCKHLRKQFLRIQWWLNPTLLPVLSYAKLNTA